eukprot:COSAG06_NODE_8934_length_2028_cov_3.613790_2_plen_61_part_00
MGKALKTKGKLGVSDGRDLNINRESLSEREIAQVRKKRKPLLHHFHHCFHWVFGTNPIHR